MSRPKIINDADLRALLAEGLSHNAIAQRLGVTRPAISKRVAALDKFALAASNDNAARAVASMWDTRSAADENYLRAVELLDNKAASPAEKRLVVKEIRQHLALGVQVLDTIYNVREVRAFTEEVLSILEKVEPNAREEIIETLRQRRVLRASHFDRGFQTARSAGASAGDPFRSLDSDQRRFAESAEADSIRAE
jgi:hypothetical protein